MELADFVSFTGFILSMELTPKEKDYLSLVLIRELIRKNRQVAEEAGIGRESQLSEIRGDGAAAALCAGLWRAYDTEHRQDQSS
jgi:hypothetical protein